MPQTFRTIPEILFETLIHRPRPDCLVWKQEGRWRELSTADVATTVLEIASGLRRLGVGIGDRVGILVPSSVDWLLFDLGALCAGAVTVPLFDNLSEEHFGFETSDSGLSTVLVANAVQHELARRHCTPETKIVTLEDFPRPDAITIADLRAGHSTSDIDAARNLARTLTGDALATVIYTSGSTGIPKGVELTHAALAFQVTATHQRYPLDPACDVSLTCLPLAHVFERMVVLFHLASGVRLVFAESIQAVGESMREQSPTVVTVVPRLLEKILERIETGAKEGGWFRRILVVSALREAARPASRVRAPLRALFDALVYRRIRKMLGGRLRIVVSGGAALGRHTEKVFLGIGIPVYQGYGLTEHGPVVAANFPGCSKTNSVGPAFPGVEIRIADDGEVLARSPSVLRGYWKQPEASAQAKNADGWLHTGDLGHLDEDGFLFLTGRKKDMCKTAAGKYVAPGPIEDLLGSHKGVEHAVVCADGRKFVSALVTPDLVAIRRRMREKHFRGSEREFLDEVFQPSIARHVERVNRKLDSWSRIRRWSLVEPFSVAMGELTPTLKVRRSAVLARHAQVLESFYANEDG